MTSHGESAFIQATANGLWIESATAETRHSSLETESGHRDVLHGKLDPKGEIGVRSASRNGLQWSLPSLQSVTDNHFLEDWKTLPGQGQRAQGTPENAMILLLPPPGSSQIACARGANPPPPPPFPPNRGRGDLARIHA